MKRFTRMIIISLAVCFAIALMTPLTFAGVGSPEPPPGEPPYGMAISSDAPGTKLVGTIMIEYYGWGGCGTCAPCNCVKKTCDTCCDKTCANARVLLRLSLNNDIQIIFREIPGVITSNGNADIQATIMNAMTPAVLQAFGFSPTSTVAVKSVSNFMVTDDFSSMLAQITGNFIHFTISDVTLAVQ
jgi:hypothetical protein